MHSMRRVFRGNTADLVRQEFYGGAGAVARGLRKRRHYASHDRSVACNVQITLSPQLFSAFLMPSKQIYAKSLQPKSIETARPSQREVIRFSGDDDPLRQAAHPGCGGDRSGFRGLSHKGDGC